MSLIHNIKNKLVQSDRYLRFRYHHRVLTAWKWFRPQTTALLQQQAQFYTGLLKSIKVPNTLIVDIGANEGFTTAIFASHGRQVVAVEPSPLNARILQARFQQRGTVTIIPKAVSDIIGTAQLFPEKNGTALHTLNPQWKTLLESGRHRLQTSFSTPIPIATTTLAALIEEFGCPAFLKIDTEGHEQQVLSTLAQPVPQLLFEAILPHFMQETIACIYHLQQLDPKAVFNYSLDHSLQLKQFISADALIPLLRQVQQSTDLICRMSNYEDYYQ